MINLIRNYKTYITELLPNNVIGEYALVLNDAPNSDIGYLLLEPGTIREESIFYHRAVGNTVYIYQENRDNPFEHADNSICLLANSIDYMNYLIGQSHDQCFIYKTGNNNLICKGGKFYIGGTNIDISDLDTSLGLTNKTLVNGVLNYIYIVDNDFKITQSLIPSEAYLVATVDVGVGGAIVSITKHKTFIVGNKGEKGDKGDQGDVGPQGPAGIDGQDGVVVPLPNYTISNTTIDRSIDANNTTAEEVLNVLGTLYNDIKDGLEAIGSEGRGIVSVVRTIGDGSPGTTDTYTITYTDSTTSTFQVYNGNNGTGGDMYKSENLSGLANVATARTNLDVYSKGEVDGLIPDISGKQDTLVSGINIKTINGNSLLGSGDITISAGASKYCNAYSTVETSTTSLTTTTVTLDTFSTNDSGMSVTNNRITITDTGAYQINASITFDSNATGIRELYVRKNGTIIKELAQGAVTPPGEYTSINISFIDSFTNGDYIELRGRQSSGGNLDILSGVKYTSLSVFKI